MVVAVGVSPPVVVVVESVGRVVASVAVAVVVESNAACCSAGAMPVWVVAAVSVAGVDVAGVIEVEVVLVVVSAMAVPVAAVGVAPAITSLSALPASGTSPCSPTEVRWPPTAMPPV